LAAFFKILEKGSLDYVIVHGLFYEPFSQATCSRKTWCVRDKIDASFRKFFASLTFIQRSQPLP